MEDADGEANLLPQKPDYGAVDTVRTVHAGPRTSDSLKRFFREVREISHEISNAKVVEWISVPCGAMSTLLRLLVATTNPNPLRCKLFRVEVALTGIETLAGFGIPPMFVLWSLYANENESVASPVVLAKERKAVRGVIGCQLILVICLVVGAIVHLHMRQDVARGLADLHLAQKRAFLLAACELAGAFIFIILGVYKWLIAKAITSVSLRADAVTCFATVYLHLVGGFGHFYDVVSFAKVGASTPASKELQRVKYSDYFSLAAAAFLLGAAVDHMRAVVKAPRSI